MPSRLFTVIVVLSSRRVKGRHPSEALLKMILPLFIFRCAYYFGLFFFHRNIILCLQAPLPTEGDYALYSNNNAAQYSALAGLLSFVGDTAFFRFDLSLAPPR